jgi:2-polyprenyl-3-methyl-5-hydroxy-6-metoxy-1,4-benzoquinol methylase
MACRYEHFTESWYRRWANRLDIQPIEVTPEAQISYRKAWEWAAILQALHERGMLQPGKRALGFAVGREPLASIFASMGVEVLASDLGEGAPADRWSATGQHAASLRKVLHRNHVDEQTFNRLVSFQPVDMNDLSGLPEAAFDFLWSACAIEHLGTLEKGLAFVHKAMRLLKPGGVAAHTTEFNISSDEDTVAQGGNCLYRRKDLEALDRRLRRDRCGLEPLDFEAGAHVFDLDYDVPPYFRDGKPHLKLQVGEFVCTSFLLIARRGA